MPEAPDELDALLETHLLSGRYALDDLIGRGGMASVYRGLDLVLGRTVAIKVLDDTAHDPTYPARLRSEARTLAALDHPHLVSLLDASVVDGRTFLVLELVEGGTLRDVVATAPLTQVKAAVLGHQLAGALAHVHDAGVIHRDIKPSNVLMAPTGPKLADFGVALLTGDATQHTDSGIMLGTAAYISPEQVQGRPATAASDIYSLGLVLLEALTGRRAYEGTAIESAMARLHRAPEFPDELSQGWRNLLASMTAMQPEDRPSARSVARHLARLSDPDRALRTSLAATRVVEEPVVPEDGEAPRRGGLSLRKALVPALAVPLVVLGLVLGPQGKAEPADASNPGSSVPQPTEQTVTLTSATTAPSTTPAPATEPRPVDAPRDRAQPAPVVGKGKPAHAGGPGGNPSNNGNGNGNGKAKAKGRG